MAQDFGPHYFVNVYASPSGHSLGCCHEARSHADAVARGVSLRRLGVWRIRMKPRPVHYAKPRLA